MTQNVVDFSDNPTGAGLMDDYLDKEQQNVLTSNSGIQRPSYAVAGTKWLDTSATPWVLKMYDGTDDVALGTVNPTTHAFIPYGVDSKQDIANLSQTLDDNTTKYPSNKAVNGAMGVFTYDSTKTYALNDYVITYADEQTVIYRSKVTNNTAVLTDENSWEKVSLGGGGLEIGDIGFAPLGVDEAQNKRRYLNGQVISQSQFVSFTNKIKAAIQLYPSLATTETNWQAEVTNSKLGQCGKFVIDNTAGTIRLPKVVNINGLQDLALLGGIKSESLPNITGCFGEAGYGDTNNYSGAFYKYGQGGSYGAFTTAHQAWFPGFDASRSSSTYQDNAPVQQEAVQYPYFIQVATGVEESVDVTREIELNNPFSLLDYKWSEYELSNASWLISNGAFHSGTVYKSVYELLLKIHNGTEIKDGVSVKLSTEAYEDTDFVLNTADTTFRLPIKVKLASGNAVAGNGMTLGLTDGTDNSGLVSYNSDSYTRVALGANPNYYGTSIGTVPAAGNRYKSTTYGITTDPTKSGIETSSSGLKLYFYVGETIQDANVIAASQVLTRVANSIDRTVASDREIVVSWGMADYSAGISKTWNRNITAENYGVVIANAKADQQTTLKAIVNGNQLPYDVIANAGVLSISFTVSKGDVYKVYDANGTGTIIFYPFKGVN